MSTSPQPLWIEQQDARLFAILHAGAGVSHSAVLICPPFLHEAMRSQRLFAQLADAIARSGCDVLRFDYAGTGDSDGDDASFTLDTALRDARAALQTLQRLSPGRPVHVLGVRAAAFVAVPLARSAGVESPWLWQPVTDGGDHLAHLRRLDAFERANPERYRRPVAASRPSSGEIVMGFECAPALLDALSGARIEATDIDTRAVCIIDGVGRASSFAKARHIELPDALSQWVDRIDMARVSSPPIEAVARALMSGQGTPR